MRTSIADLTISGLPDDWTILQGYFVWSGVDDEGHRGSGGVEYPFNLEEDETLHDYDGHKIIGMLTVAREMLIQGEMDGHTKEEEG